MKAHRVGLLGAVCAVAGLGFAVGFDAAAVGALALISAAGCYGAWRFHQAYRLTGSRLGLVAAALSLVSPVVAVVTIGSGAGGPLEAGAVTSSGAIVLAGFGLSRAKQWHRLRLGLWLPHAVAAWRRGDVAPLEHILESTLGEKSAAHAARTAALAHTLAEPLTLSANDVSDIVLAALVHPLGAIVSGERAACPAPTGSAVHAARMIANIPAAAGASDLLRHFDERWDGGGPLGLAGERILLGARLLSAIEAFDRASEAGLEPAIAAIRLGSGTAFDPVVAAEIIHLFRTNTALAAA